MEDKTVAAEAALRKENCGLTAGPGALQGSTLAWTLFISSAQPESCSSHCCTRLMF